MRLVTSGSAYVDIDAYAGCVAYAELLQTHQEDAQAVSTAPLNESISETVHSWHAPLLTLTEYNPSEDDTFTLIDVSDPSYFDKIVDIDRVDEVIDHHPGFEKHWQGLIGDKSDIEFIGAACTLVYERWRAAGQLGRMSVLSARLLICGILDNTLNFGAEVTTERDRRAFEDLHSRAELPSDWTAQYFTECQEAILQDPVTAIQNDTKMLSFKSFGQPIRFGQLVVWDGQQVLSEHQPLVKETLGADETDWVMNLISVGEGKSYFITDNKDVQGWMSGLLDLQFNGSIAAASRLWLRKEVIKQDIANS